MQFFRLSLGIPDPSIDTQPCDYAFGADCEGLPTWNWVCCNDGSLQACNGETKTIKRYNCPIGKTCIPGSFSCDISGGSGSDHCKFDSHCQ